MRHGQRQAPYPPEQLGSHLTHCSGGAPDPARPRLTHEYLFDRCLTIAGGTSEVTRNVIAERNLGLPREPDMR